MTGPAPERTLRFHVVGATGGEPDTLTVPVRRVIVAGYTGRDRAAVTAHIDELAAIGIAPPPRVPMFYEVPPARLSTEPVIAVDGPRTSGEAEPVLVRCSEGTFVAVGSDHTDREVEKRDIGESKAACPKPISPTVVALDRVVAVWDECGLTCRVDGDPYQDGRLAALTTPSDLLAALAGTGERLDVGDVMFCGTVPLLTGDFVFGSRYEVGLRLPDGACVGHEYRVTTARS